MRSFDLTVLMSKDGGYRRQSHGDDNEAAQLSADMVSSTNLAAPAYRDRHSLNRAPRTCALCPNVAGGITTAGAARLVNVRPSDC